MQSPRRRRHWRRPRRCARPTQELRTAGEWHYDFQVHSLLVGFGLGFFVALQLGPMSLFLIRSTLRGGLKIGLAIGAGIAIVDALYAALGAAGVAPLLLIEPVRVTLGLVGAGVLAFLGARTLHTAFRVRHGAEFDGEVATPRSALKTSLA